MNEDKKHPKMLPAKVVGLLREKCRQLAAAYAALEAKTQGQAVEIEQLRAALAPALSAFVWEGADLTAADTATLQVHFREQIAPLIEDDLQQRSGPLPRNPGEPQAASIRRPQAIGARKWMSTPLIGMNRTTAIPRRHRTAHLKAWLVQA